MVCLVEFVCRSVRLLALQQANNQIIPICNPIWLFIFLLNTNMLIYILNHVFLKLATPSSFHFASLDQHSFFGECTSKMGADAASLLR